MRKTPRSHSKRPPLSIFWVIAPGRAGKSLECGRRSCFRSKQRRAFHRKLRAWDVGWSCFAQQQQHRQSQTGTQPLSQPGRRSTVSHEAAVVAAQAGVVDHPELRRCRVGLPPLRPHTVNAPVQMSEGKREGLLRAVPPGQQAREPGPACLCPRGRHLTRTTEPFPRV